MLASVLHNMLENVAYIIAIYMTPGRLAMFFESCGIKSFYMFAGDTFSWSLSDLTCTAHLQLRWDSPRGWMQDLNWAISVITWRSTSNKTVYWSPKKRKCYLLELFMYILPLILLFTVHVWIKTISRWGLIDQFTIKMVLNPLFYESELLFWFGSLMIWNL